MADNVTGQIGADSVFLENAATEATLRLILQATLATTKEQKKAISDLVQKAGLDPAKVEAANKSLGSVGSVAAKTGIVLAVLNDSADKANKIFRATSEAVGKLTSGAAQASDAFGMFAGMGGVVGLIGTGFQKLAKFQEDQLSTYQQLTNSGISFGGSLTDMRLSASKMGLTMEQLANLVKTNSDTFAKMGGSAEGGMQQFKLLSAEMRNSEIGKNMRALGFTSEQMNQSLVSYIATTGGRTKAEMSDRAALVASTGAYMEQLDRLADVTGKSREKQEEELKAAMQEADVQITLSRMTKEDREAFSAAMEEAGTLYGQAGRDVVIAQAQGRAVTGKAGQMLMATASGAAQTVSSLQAVAKQYGRNSQEFIDASNKSRDQAGKALSTIPTAVFSMHDGLKGMGDVTKTVSRDAMNGMTTRQAMSKADQEREDAKAKRLKSEADAAAKTQKAVQDLGTSLLTKLMPAISGLLTVMNGLVTVVGAVFTVLNKIPFFFELLGLAVVAVTAKYLYQKTAMALGGAKGGAGKILETVTGGGGKAAGGVSGALGGAGGGGMLEGLGAGIKSVGSALAGLGPQAPMILAGSAAVGGAIVLIGAGIAGATWLMGKALPSLAEGLTSFGEIDGMNLIKVGAGVAALGAGLAVFGAGGVMASVGGAISGLVDGLGSLVGVKSPVEKLKDFAALGPGLEQSGKGMQAFTTSMNALLNTDLSKISKLTEELAKLKAASTPAEKGIVATAGDVIKTAITGGAGGGAGGDTSDLLRREIQTLNKQTTDLLRAMREAADNTAKTASLIANNGNLFRA